jgi:hypothetical protein
MPVPSAFLPLVMAFSALTPLAQADEVPPSVYHTAALDFFPNYRDVIKLREHSPSECLARAAVLASFMHTDPDLALHSGKAVVMGACLNRDAYLAASEKMAAQADAAYTKLRPSQVIEALVGLYSQAGVGDVGFAYSCNPSAFPADAQKLAATAQRMLRSPHSLALPVDRAAAARVCTITAGRGVAPAGYVTGMPPKSELIAPRNLMREQRRPLGMV